MTVTLFFLTALLTFSKLEFPTVRCINVIEVPLNLRTHLLEDVNATEYETETKKMASNSVTVNFNIENKNDEKEENFAGINLDETKQKHPCQRPCKPNQPMICRYNFTIEYFSTMSKACMDCPFNVSHCDKQHCIAANGIRRTILSVNRQLPGPKIEVCYGDIIEIKVINDMLDIGTSIHWHGLFQQKTPYMDGVPFVGQCLIEPRTSFLYRFYADNIGTHMWHGHSAVQRGDGIYGPLVVRAPVSKNTHKELYDYDLSEHVFTIMDWSHKFSANKLATHLYSAGDNKPDSLLINGKGRYREFKKKDKIIFTPSEIFSVNYGFRYRFRLVNSGFLACPIKMSIDNHNITIISTDGNDIEPVETDSLISVAGERFDFIINADKEPDNYWMRFKGLLDCSVNGVFQVAILHYRESNSTQDPAEDVIYETAERSGLEINSVNTPMGVENKRLISTLKSTSVKKKDPTLKPEADLQFYLAFDFYPVDNVRFQYAPLYPFYKVSEELRIRTPQINHISMEFPNFPLMGDIEKSKTVEICNGTSVSLNCRFEFCQCFHVLKVPLNAVVELILIDEGLPYNANHPFHLHGTQFKVLGMDRLGNKTTEDEVRILDKEGLLKRNLENPPIKDTISVPDGGYVILRFHATNPGYWILHCHIDFHMEMGMALLFKVGDEADFIKPPIDFPKCGNSFNDLSNSTGTQDLNKVKTSSSSGFPNLLNQSVLSLFVIVIQLLCFYT